MFGKTHVRKSIEGPCLHLFLFAGVSKVVDLCAAPGSWSQVLSTKLRFELFVINDQVLSTV